MEITLYALANYNNGFLVPKTFDLTEYEDGLDYQNAVYEWLDTVPYPYEDGRTEEEYIIADYYGIPAQFVDEYDLSPDFWEYAELRRDVQHSQIEAFDVFYELFHSGSGMPDFQESYVGHFESKIEFVEHWLVEVQGFENYAHSDVCIDFETTEKVICANNAISEHRGYYFQKI